MVHLVQAIKLYSPNKLEAKLVLNKEVLTATSTPNIENNPNSTVHGANMAPTWVLSDPDGGHVGLMSFAFWEGTK